MLRVKLMHERWEWFDVGYRCEDGRIPVSVGCMTISNPESFSSVETGLNPGIRS